MFLSLNHFDPNLISTIKRHCDVEFCIYEFPENSKLSKGKFYCRYIYDNKKFLFYRLYTDPSLFHSREDRAAFEYNVSLFSDKLKGTSDNRSKVVFSPEELSDALKYPVISTKPSGNSVKLSIKPSPRARTKEPGLKSPVQTPSPPSSSAASSISSPAVSSPYFTRESKAKEKHPKPEKSRSSHKKLDKPLSESSTLYGSDVTDSDSDDASDSSSSEQYRTRPPPKKRLSRQKADIFDSPSPVTRQPPPPSAALAAGVQSSPPAAPPGSLQAYEAAEAAGKGQKEETKKLCPYFLCGVCPLGELCSLSHEFPKPPLRYEPPRNIGHFKSAIRGLVVGKNEVLETLKKFFVSDNMSNLEGLYVIRNCGFGIRSGDVKYRIGKVIRVVNCFQYPPTEQERRFGLVIGCEKIPETEIVTKVDALANLNEIDEETMNECMSRYVIEVAKHKMCQLPTREEVEELKKRISSIKSNISDEP